MTMRRIVAAVATSIWVASAPAADWVQDTQASRLDFVSTYEGAGGARAVSRLHYAADI